MRFDRFVSQNRLQVLRRRNFQKKTTYVYSIVLLPRDYEKLSLVVKSGAISFLSKTCSHFFTWRSVSSPWSLESSRYYDGGRLKLRSDRGGDSPYESGGDARRLA